VFAYKELVYMATNEQDILKELKAHNEDGLKQLFDMYYKPLVIYSVKFVRNLEAGEDIVQDFFIRFWEDKKYMNISGSLRSYLFSSIRNASIDYMKVHARLDGGSIEDYPDHFSDETYEMDELDERRRQLYAEIAKLSPQSKRVFEAIILENRKYKEVAEALGISLNTVKTLFSRSLRKLRNSLDIIIILLLP
jgi:RNA polymerase sigma-70 factor (family 1)